MLRCARVRRVVLTVPLLPPLALRRPVPYVSTAAVVETDAIAFTGEAVTRAVAAIGDLEEEVDLRLRSVSSHFESSLREISSASARVDERLVRIERELRQRVSEGEESTRVLTTWWIPTFGVMLVVLMCACMGACYKYQRVRGDLNLRP